MNERLARKTVTILGVRTHSTSIAQVLRFVRSSLKNKNKFIITTPNPEIIIIANSDNDLKGIINRSDIAVIDGFGAAAAAKYLSIELPKSIILRVPLAFGYGIVTGLSIIFYRRWILNDFKVIKGRELFLDLTEFADKNKLKVFFLGAMDGVADKAGKRIRKEYKSIYLKSAAGPVLNIDGQPVDNENNKIENNTIKNINKFQPDILFIAFGAPKQEKWIAKNIDQLSIGGAMVVGGTFDYVSGKVKLPPKWISNLELEWLWRLFFEPKRARRIINATIVFPWRVFLYKLKEY